MNCSRLSTWRKTFVHESKFKKQAFLLSLPARFSKVNNTASDLGSFIHPFKASSINCPHKMKSSKSFQPKQRPTFTFHIPSSWTEIQGHGKCPVKWLLCEVLVVAKMLRRLRPKSLIPKYRSKKQKLQCRINTMICTSFIRMMHKIKSAPKILHRIRKGVDRLASPW